MLDVCLLGTGGMMPLPDRFLSSAMFRHNGRLLLMDCGEGTQVAIKKHGWGFKNIDAICFTHYHADHVSGLSGMLLTIANAGRTQAVTLIGPVGLKFVVEGLLRICSELPFGIDYVEIVEENPKPIKIAGFEISCAWAEHRVFCLGYRIDIRRGGKFLIDKALAFGLPKKLWSALQRGDSIEHNGKAYVSSDVMSAPRKGISVAFSTDTRPTEAITKLANGVDLFICEGMYGENEKIDKAKEHKHMLFSEAAEMAKRANAKRLWLTHISPSVKDPLEFAQNATSIFEPTVIGEDGLSTTINFTD